MRLKYYKHFIITLLTVIVSITAVSSQELKQTHQNQTSKGDHLLYGGLGFINPTAFTFSIFSASGGGNPSVSGNINYQYAATSKFLIGAFAGYYRVNADYQTSLRDLEALFSELTLTDLLTQADCILLGNCSTTITERISVYTIGGKLSFIKKMSSNLESYISGYLGYSFNRRKTITESALDIISAELDLKTEVPSFIYFSSAGLRYFINENLALQGEIGYGNSHLMNVGVSYKL